jgi:formate-dependent nitrite reductase membrane component NrfD
LTSGAYSLPFWLGAVAVGSVLPLVLGVLDLRRRSTGLTALASVLVLIGGFLVKFVIVAAGQV